MNTHTKKIQALFSSVVLTGMLVVGGWSIYNDNGNIANAQVSVADYETQIRVIDVGIQRFQAVALDAAFLSSPGFRQLKDFSVTLPPVLEIGRENPFLALPDVDPDTLVGLPERDEDTTQVLSESTEASGESFDFDTSFLDDFQF